MIEKIVTGGQTGVDLGALLAAKECGIQTGGWMPFGWETEAGPQPAYAQRFGLQEHPCMGMTGHSDANVRDSDGTLVIAADFNSPGTKSVIEAAKKFRKPLMQFSLDSGYHPIDVNDWIALFNIKVLNIAGNRESVSPGIQSWTTSFVAAVLRQ